MEGFKFSIFFCFNAMVWIGLFNSIDNGLFRLTVDANYIAATDALNEAFTIL